MSKIYGKHVKIDKQFCEKMTMKTKDSRNINMISRHENDFNRRHQTLKTGVKNND